jgi:phospholipid transport system substrate-binding protein
MENTCDGEYHFMRTTWVLTSIVSILLGFSLSSQAAPAVANTARDPQALIHGAVEELRMAIVHDKMAINKDPNRAITLVDRIVLPHVDTNRVGRLILGQHWRNATPEQRRQFVDNYRRLLLRTYAVHVSDYADVKVEYLSSGGTTNNSKRTVVRTRVSHAGNPASNVDYRMYLTANGWKVYDVAVTGISLVATFRATVNSEINRYGLDGLIARLIEKNSRPLTH